MRVKKIIFNHHTLVIFLVLISIVFLISGFVLCILIDCDVYYKPLFLFGGIVLCFVGLIIAFAIDKRYTEIRVYNSERYPIRPVRFPVRVKNISDKNIRY